MSAEASTGTADAAASNGASEVDATPFGQVPAIGEIPRLETLSIEVDGKIGTLTLNRPKSMNAMSPQMIYELSVAGAWFADRADLRALIVTGAGNAFSAGGDVKWFKQGIDEESIDLPSEVRRGAAMIHQAIIDFRRIPYPVIAAINGAAAGAGMSLALACDIRIASDKAALVCAYGRIGASPDGGMTYFLPRVVGPAKAIEILLEDPLMGAEDAKARGLVSEVVPHEDLLTAARKTAERLAKRAPHYVRMSKLLVASSLDHDIAEHLELERHGIADSMATEDLRGGVKAFFSGEKYEFQGR